MKPYFTAAMAENGKNVERWAGQTSQKSIKKSIYNKLSKRK